MKIHSIRPCFFAGIAFCATLTPALALKLSSPLEEKKDPLSIHKKPASNAPRSFMPITMRSGFLAPLTSQEPERVARPLISETEVLARATAAREAFEAQRHILSPEIKAVVPEEIWRVVPTSVLHDLGFGRDPSPAALSQRFFHLYNEIRQAHAVGIDPAQMQQAAYLSLVKSSYYLKIVTASAAPEYRSDLLISTAQLCRWAAADAPTLESRNSLIAQARERLNKGSQDLFAAYTLDVSWGHALEAKLHEESEHLNQMGL